MVGPSYKLLPDQEETSEDTARPLQATALIVLSVVGSGANILVSIVFHRRPALRSPSNRFVLSLVLANLMTSFIVVPILLVQVLHHEVAALSWLRQVSSGLTTLAVTAAIFSVLAIAVDRYNAVLSPLHYAMTITRGRSRAMIAGAWGVAGLLATPPFLGALLSPVPATVAVHYSNCTAGDEGEVFRLTYALVLVTLGFTLPLFALCWIYARMYNAAHRNSERTRRHSISANPGEVVASRGGSLDLSVPPASSGTPENFRRPWKSPPLSIGMPKRRPSNASFSALLFREEGRAVKTAAMVITSYLFCWTPYFVTLLIDTWGGVGATVDSYKIEANLVPEPFRSLALLTALSSGCVTPFIYVFRNEAARKEAVKVLLWWRPRSGKYGGNVARCSRDFETYSSNGKAVAAGNSFGPPPVHHDNFSLRRQSLSYCDSVSVQSFHIPTAALTSSSDCHHCMNANVAANGPGTADFVATYEVIESPNGDETQQNVGENPSAGKPVAKTRRESVTFRLAFLPQRRCQTCIRQSSDSSSGSGHPLVRHSDGTDGRGTPPVTSNPMSSLVKMTVSQRRQQFLIGRQGSSGEELTPGSDPETPHHMISVDRRLVDYGEEATSLDIPQQVFPQNNNNNDPATSKNDGVMLELEEQTNDGVRTGPRSAAMFQFQETSLERFSALSASLENCMPVDPEVMVTRQDSGHSDTTVRQDSNFSDVTVDSGVVPDLVPFNHSQSSSSSISTASFSAPPRPKRHRHKLQRLAAVEDEDMAPPLEEPIPAPSLRTVKSRLKSSFKSRFYRPAFRIPKCDF
ncbi:uncharacterized protein LOC111870653 [Cryptotermes secundus]|uniref:uncharacterized protein LOC111870653 n=1 Tax=Cryptotermes secundus TaxID=105785 RepID=UPI001454BBF9|nr:uncharacterized protein LOC111870653 [Cryptotermes secundus]